MPGNETLMRRIGREFLYWALAIATMGGFYLAMEAANHEWVFWVIFAILLAVLTLRFGAPKAIGWAKRILRTYREGLDYKRISDLADARMQELSALEARERSASSKGILEGRRRVVSEILGASTDTSLSIISMSVRGDRLQVVAEVALGDPPPLVGGAWRLMSRGQTLLYAVCTVVDLASEDGADFAHLQVDRVILNEPIEELKVRARTSPDVSDIWRLRPRTVTNLQDLAKELAHD